MRRSKSSNASRRRSLDDVEDAEIPMTPMIDVVFLLLIYFLMTMQPMDVIAHLGVNVPTPPSPEAAARSEPPPSMIRIGVHAEGFSFEGCPVDEPNLDRFVTLLARASRTQAVMIQCDRASSHGRLVRVLDLCARCGLENLSVNTAE